MKKKLKSSDAIKIITVRKNIMNKLDLVYPSGLSIKDIMQVNSIIDPFYDWDLFQKDITYLKEKGYIAFIDKDPNLMKSTEQKIIKLTATGKEIAEGTMIDEALEISFTSNND
ncbi:MAG: hypothetical protein WC454_03410 [Phycisphaerae bacterium]|jgi:hypothetical protein